MDFRYVRNEIRSPIPHFAHTSNSITRMGVAQVLSLYSPLNAYYVGCYPVGYAYWDRYSIGRPGAFLMGNPPSIGGLQLASILTPPALSILQCPRPDRFGIYPNLTYRCQSIAEYNDPSYLYLSYLTYHVVARTGYDFVLILPTPSITSPLIVDHLAGSLPAWMI